MTTDSKTAQFMALLSTAGEKAFAANAILNGAQYVGINATSSTKLLDYLRGATAAAQELNNLLLGHEPGKQG